MYKRLIVTFLILADGLLSAFARQARDVINLNNGNHLILTTFLETEGNI